VAYNPDRYNRRSIRLQNHDYAKPGGYFVTTCTAGREPLFAETALYSAVEEAWTWLPTRFKNVDIDEFVIMPDHVHFVVVLTGQGGQMAAPTLAHVVGAFKTVAAKAINRARDSVGNRVWQRNYYERIIRNCRELDRIRAYIRANPEMAHDHAHDDVPSGWL
jgi:REP element-mobilizing transposase RayT